jgi:SWIM zinc finger
MKLMHKYRVTGNPEDGYYQVHHVVHVSKPTCTCGMWQRFGIPCLDLDAMKYFQEKEMTTLAEIIDSEAVSDFHKYPYYQEFSMKGNIEPVILDNLVASKDDIPCPAPEVVLRHAGHPPTKRLQVDKSHFSKPEEESTIVSYVLPEHLQGAPKYTGALNNVTPYVPVEHLTGAPTVHRGR